MITIKEAANKLGLSRRWVQQLAKKGKLPALKMGRDYLIEEKDLYLVRNLTRGRPGKNDKN